MNRRKPELQALDVTTWPTVAWTELDAAARERFRSRMQAIERYALGDFAAAFGGRRQDEIGCGHRRHFDMQVDAVDQRAGNPRLIVGGAAGVGPAAAGKAGFAGAAAAARIHCPDQHEPRRIGDAMIGAGNGNLAGFQRLAQRVERLRLEFRQLVEEQHAVVRERDFARPRVQAAADQRRHAGGMMRGAERTAVGQRATFDFAGDRSDHGDFEQFRHYVAFTPRPFSRISMPNVRYTIDSYAE